MSILRQHRRLALPIALIALIANGLAMVCCPMGAARSSDVADLLGPVVICTVEGIKELPSGGVAAPAEKSGGHGDMCDACLILCHMAAAALVAAVVLLLFGPLAGRTVPRPASRLPAVRTAPAASYLSTGPPLPA
jgi:hypothetical protein